MYRQPSVGIPNSMNLKMFLSSLLYRYTRIEDSKQNWLAGIEMGLKLLSRYTFSSFLCHYLWKGSRKDVTYTRAAPFNIKNRKKLIKIFNETLMGTAKYQPSSKCLVNFWHFSSSKKERDGNWVRYVQFMRHAIVCMR